MSIQSCPSSIESSSPKVAATHLSYISAASRSMLKSSSGVLEYMWKIFLIFLVFELSIQKTPAVNIKEHYSYGHTVEENRSACAAHNKRGSIRLQENFTIGVDGKDSSVHIL